MSTDVLAAAVAEATDDELRAARRLVHRAGLSRRLNAVPERHYPPIDGSPYPRLLAAVCVELDDELARRGGPLPGCIACRREVAEGGDSPTVGAGEPALASAVDP